MKGNQGRNSRLKARTEAETIKDLLSKRVADAIDGQTNSSMSGVLRRSQVQMVGSFSYSLNTM